MTVAKSRKRSPDVLDNIVTRVVGLLVEETRCSFAIPHARFGFVRINPQSGVYCDEKPRMYVRTMHALTFQKYLPEFLERLGPSLCFGHVETMRIECTTHYGIGDTRESQIVVARVCTKHREGVVHIAAH